MRETHIAWIESHAWDDQSPSPAQVYGWYWNETLGGAALDGAKVAEAAATASAVAKSMGLDEVVDYLRDPDQVAFYGMMNILPATPIRWSLENVEAADRHLHYGLARWYHRPLEASLVPIDVITGVLRTRRPYYYHRMLAHALLQTVCVQRVLAARNSGGRHRGETGGLLRPDARRLSATVPVSSKAEDHPGVGGILERFGGAAFPRWASRHPALFPAAGRPSTLPWRRSCTGDRIKAGSLVGAEATPILWEAGFCQVDRFSPLVQHDGKATTQSHRPEANARL